MRSCRCSTLLKCDVDGFSLAVKVKTFSSREEGGSSSSPKSSSGSALMDIDVVKVVDIARMPPQSMVDMTKGLIGMSSDFLALSLCDIRAHVSRSESESRESESGAVKQLNTFHRKLFAMDSMALCQVSGSIVDAIRGPRMTTRHAILVPNGALQSLLYLDADLDRDPSSPTLYSLWKTHTRSSLPRTKSNGGSEASEPTAKANPATTKAEKASLVKRKSQSFNFSSSSTTKTLFKPSGPSEDQLRSLEELQMQDTSFDGGDNMSVTSTQSMPSKPLHSEPNMAVISSVESDRTVVPVYEGEEESNLFPALQPSPRRTFSNSSTEMKVDDSVYQVNRLTLQDNSNSLLGSSNLDFYISATGEESYLLNQQSLQAQHQQEDVVSFQSPAKEASGTGVRIFSFISSSLQQGQTKEENRIAKRLDYAEDCSSSSSSSLLAKGADDMPPPMTVDLGHNDGSNLTYSPMSSQGAAPLPLQSEMEEASLPSSQESAPHTPVNNQKEVSKPKHKSVFTEEELASRREVLQPLLNVFSTALTALPDAISQELVDMIADCFILGGTNPIICGKNMAKLCCIEPTSSSSCSPSSSNKTGAKGKKRVPASYEIVFTALEAVITDRSVKDAVSLVAVCQLCLVYLFFIIEVLSFSLSQPTSKSKASQSNRKKLIKTVQEKLSNGFDRLLLTTANPVLVDSSIPLVNLACLKNFLTGETVAAMSSKYAIYQTYRQDQFHATRSRNLLLSPTTSSIRKNGININRHLDLVVSFIRMMYIPDMTASSNPLIEAIGSVVNEYDFVLQATKESPIKNSEEREKEEIATRQISRRQQKTFEELGKVLGKRKANDSESVSDSANEVLRSNAVAAAISEPMNDNAKTSASTAAQHKSILKTVKGTVSHRSSMKTQLKQTVVTINKPINTSHLVASKSTAESKGDCEKHVGPSLTASEGCSGYNLRRGGLSSPAPLSKSARSTLLQSPLEFTPVKRGRTSQVVYGTPMDSEGTEKENTGRLTRSSQKQLDMFASPVKTPLFH